LTCIVLLAAACSKGGRPAPAQEPVKHSADAGVDSAPSPAPVEAHVYPDLATALAQTIPADARVLGFGELHVRTDRKQVKTTTLARFTEQVVPALADKLSDLIVETWVVDPSCGQQAKNTTAKVEATVRRPAETKSEIALLAEAARAQKIQPHAMRLSCADYDRLAPKDGNDAANTMLDITTRELRRIAREAVVHRDKLHEPRPWIALYGGALHNDRFPIPGLEIWSYAADVDKLTNNRYVELDLFIPELAEGDPALRDQPWYGLVTAADDKVHVYKRGERSFVFVLPKGQ
jgi:hypothetical protein